MLRLLITFVAVSYASATLHSICHSNQQLTEAQVIDQLATLCDKNDDGNITEAEIVVAVFDILEATLPLPEDDILAMDYEALIGNATLFEFSVDRQDFIQKWHARFHDSHEFVGATFDAFDDNNDGVWNVVEIDDILQHIKTNSDDGDGVISKAEFKNYFTEIYQNC